MRNGKNGAKKTLLDRMLDDASWSVSRALGLQAIGSDEADAEWLRAATREKEVACLLEAKKQDVEAAIHYVSAASCYARVGQFSHAVPLLRSALSFSVRDACRRDVEKLLKQWLPKAEKQFRQQRRTEPAAVS
jgi:hypothetical protein